MEIIKKSNIIIKKGTIVLRDDNNPITLLDDVYVHANKLIDGSWSYLIGIGKKGTAYQVSGGCVTII